MGAASTTHWRPLQHPLEGAATVASVRKFMHGVIAMNHEMQYGDGLDDGAGDGLVGSDLEATEGCSVVATRRAKARKRPAMSLEDAMAWPRLLCVKVLRAWPGA